MTATIIEEIKDIIATVIAAKLESGIALFQYVIIYSFFLIIVYISCNVRAILLEPTLRCGNMITSGVAITLAIMTAFISMGAAFASSDLEDVPTIGDILGNEETNTEDIPFYPQCGDLVKFYRMLDDIIAMKSLPKDQADYIEKIEKGLLHTTACEEYFKGLKFELWSAK